MLYYLDTVIVVYAVEGRVQRWAWRTVDNAATPFAKRQGVPPVRSVADLCVRHNLWQTSNSHSSTRTKSRRSRLLHLVSVGRQVRRGSVRDDTFVRPR
jgi:hypothetical protein